MALAIVVPAHNEEDRIAGCVAAILDAAAHPALSGVAVHLALVFDDCHDATGARATEALRPALGYSPPASLTMSAVSVNLGNVGRARALGVALAVETLTAALGAAGVGGPGAAGLEAAGLEAAGLDAVGGAAGRDALGLDPEAVWVATTDADSVVPPDWLAHQLELRAAGAQGCAGTVIVDSWAEHPDGTRRSFELRYHGEDGLAFGHAHVHGTNLGVSLAAYRAAGGFPPLATGEDQALWDALVAADTTLVSTPLAPVVTSGRRVGRSPEGFAALLGRLGAVPA